MTLQIWTRAHWRRLATGLLATATLTGGALAAAVSSPQSSPRGGARTVRFADLAPADAEAFLAGDADVTVEFRDGDRLPLGLKVGGDLLATSGDGAAVLRVQRTFFVRRADGGVELSLDGVAFAPWGDLVTGFLRANASSSDGARVDRLEVESEVRLRPDTP